MACGLPDAPDGIVRDLRELACRGVSWFVRVLGVDEQIGRGYSLPEVSGLCGVEYRTLHTWLRRGLITASRQEASGSGSRNELAYSDLVVTKALSDLRRLGLELQPLTQVATVLRSTDAMSDTVVLVNGEVQAVPAAQEPAALGQTRGPVLVLRLAEVRQSLQ